MNETVSATLKGCRILVVEDEYLIARDLDETLTAVGAETLGPVPSVADALHLIATEARIDGALLDINLYHEEIWPVVDALLKQNVPLVLATGYDASKIPRAYAHLPRREKPANGQQLTSALAKALAASS